MTPDSRSFLKLFSEKPIFTVIHKDSIAELVGQSSVKKLVGVLTVTCDLKRNLVTGSIFKTEFDTMKQTMEYAQNEGMYVQKKVTLAYISKSQKWIMVDLYAGVKVNAKVDRKLFKINKK